MTSATGISLFWGGVTPIPDGAVLTTAPINNTDSGPSSVNDRLTIGQGFKRGEIPKGFIVVPEFTVNGVTTAMPHYQCDRRKTYDDGSLSHIEMPHSVPAAIPGADKGQISFVKQEGSFNNALPNGLTKAGLISMVLADPSLDLVLTLSNMTSCTGQPARPTTIGSGAWVNSVRDALNNGKVEFTHSGPVCGGFRAYGAFKDKVTGAVHDSLRMAWVVKYHFLPDGSAQIIGVEYTGDIFNGELNATYEIDRYNYDVALTRNGVLEPEQPVLVKAVLPKITNITVANGIATVTCDTTSGLTTGQIGNFNGAVPAVWNQGYYYTITVVDENHFTMGASDTVPPTSYGTFSTMGGHNGRSKWKLRLGNGKLRFAKMPATKLVRTLGDAGRSYLAQAGHLYPFDTAIVPARTPNGVPYSPLTKTGLVPGKGATDMAGVDSGGDNDWLGVTTETCSAAILLDTSAMYDDMRVVACTRSSMPIMYVDTNGRIANLIGGTYTGMTPAQIDTYRYRNRGVGSGVTPTVGDSWVENGGWTGTDGSVNDRYMSHDPSMVYNTHQLEGGVDFEHDLLLDAGYALMTYPAVSRNRNGFVGVIIDASVERIAAWAMTKLIDAYHACPEYEADNVTPYGEKAYLKDVMSNNLGFAAMFINTQFLDAEKNLGMWSHSSTGNGSDDGWMDAYFELPTAMMNMRWGESTEPFAADIKVLVGHKIKYFIGLYTINPSPAFVKCVQTMQVRMAIGSTPDSAPFFRDWTQVGFHGDGNVPFGGIFTTAIGDHQTGWFYCFPGEFKSLGTIPAKGTGLPFWSCIPGGSGGTVPGQTQVGPFVGDEVFFACDYESTPSPNPVAGLSFNTSLFVTEVDQANNRLRLSATKGGPPLTFSADQLNGLLLCWRYLVGPIPAGVGPEAYGNHAFEHQAAIRMFLYSGVNDPGMIEANKLVTDFIATSGAISPSQRTRFQMMVNP